MFLWILMIFHSSIYKMSNTISYGRQLIWACLFICSSRKTSLNTQMESHNGLFDKKLVAVFLNSSITNVTSLRVVYHLLFNLKKSPIPFSNDVMHFSGNIIFSLLDILRNYEFRIVTSVNVQILKVFAPTIESTCYVPGESMSFLL